MDFQAVLFKVLEIVVPVLVTYILGLVTVILQHRLGDAKYWKAYTAIGNAVSAVEQVAAGQLTSNQKKLLAITYARRLGAKLTDEQISVILEAIVKGYNDYKKNVITPAPSEKPA